MKKIVLTGGGTAGHVTPNIALIPRLRSMGYEPYYIGSYSGIEKDLISEIGVPYYGIATGKFRRYHSIKNLSDPFRVIHGMDEAGRIIHEIKPDVVFSKGGFVSVPVVVSASALRIPIIIHESDMTPGLANKLSLPHATRICCNFPETAASFKEGLATVTGTPIREELYHGDADRARSFCGFTDERPVILIVGGSTGAASVNEAIWAALPELLKSYNVIHICGKGKCNKSLSGLPGYSQHSYIKKELPDIMALSDIVISRAGANAICELLALKKPNILIPLPLSQSRGDQILNAESFEKSGYSYVLKDEDLSTESILSAVSHVSENKDSYIRSMMGSTQADAIDMITGIIDSVTLKSK